MQTPTSQQEVPLIAPPGVLPSKAKTRGVTLRAFFAGLLLSGGLAWLNCWLETLYDVHFLGGIQMPFGAVFALLVLVLGVNLPLRALHRYAPFSQKIVAPLAPTELLTIYEERSECPAACGGDE